ncbi:MAG: PAS domain S-box protein [Anaerolineae bacterium]|nr:PAS domain S-box protein [Anaerolineae bacterium]
MDKPDGHICFDVIRRGSREPLVVNNLLESAYATTDPNVVPYQLQTYIGQAVACQNTPVGSLCVVYQRDFVPDLQDIQLLTTLAMALSIEEERKRSEQALLDSYQLLEHRVDQRTADLKAANAQLHQEIVERKQAETALRQSEERFRNLIEQSQDGILLMDTDTCIIEWNPVLARITGITREEAVGQPFTLLQNNMVLEHRGTPENIERVSTTIKHYFTTKQADWDQLSFQSNVLRPDGTGCITQSIVFPIMGGEHPMLGCITRDITELKIAGEQAFQLELEQERSRILADFIRDASQEFSTPLSVIKTSTYLLTQIDDPEKQKQHMASLDKQVAHIQALIESMIDMARLDSDDDIPFQRFDINKLIDEIRVRITSIAEKKELALRCDLQANLPLIDGNHKSLHQAMIKLVENAFEFTPAGGSITLRTHQEKDTVVITVKDTGIGIHAADLDRIFERFYRVDPARSRRGAGLGLAIAKKIAENHLGHIDVESTPGEGSAFRLVLPISPG